MSTTRKTPMLQANKASKITMLKFVGKHIYDQLFHLIFHH
jgi:hypothetical protein